MGRTTMQIETTFTAAHPEATGAINYSMMTKLQHPADYPRSQATVDDAVRRRAPLRLEWRLLRPNGEVRIIERASNEILARFGRVGRQAGEFTAVHNIAVDGAGNIYTAEVQTGQRIQKFRKLN